MYLIENEINRFRKKNLSSVKLESEIDKEIPAAISSFVTEKMAKEIKKTALLTNSNIEKLGESIGELKKEIANINFENERLKKELYSKNKEAEKNLKLLIDVLNTYSAVNNLKEKEENKNFIELVEKKISGLLFREQIEEIAHVGQKYDPRYHEALNESEIDNSKESYVITAIAAQGYLREGKPLKIAKVIIA